MNFIKKLLKWFRYKYGFYEYSSEKSIYNYVNSKINFIHVDEIYKEYFGYISFDDEDYKTMLKYYDFNIKEKDKFYIDETSLISIYTIRKKDGQIYQFIKRYLSDYNIYTCYFRKINQIPTISFKRQLIYKENYFYDCYNFNTQRRDEKLFIKEIILDYKSTSIS